MLTITTSLDLGQLGTLVHGGVERAINSWVQETAANVVAGAMERAPVKTGTLRRSIHWLPLSATSALVLVGVHYGIYVEFGTSRMAARPFLTPSVEMARRDAASRLAVKLMAA